MRLSLKWLDQSGGVWLGAWTSLMLGLSAYATFASKDVPGGAVASYAAALTAFAAHSVSKVVSGAKAAPSTPPAVGFGLNPERDGE